MAGRIPSNFIDELLARSDIVEIIERFVPLQKKGQEYMARCPFHEERTPSFSVSPRKQIYYCFGCGVGGSVLKFLMEYRKMDFVEAVETLAQFEGIEVPREGGRAPGEKQHKPILAALSKASEFYRKNLTSTPTASHYLTQRGIDETTSAAFNLGYAPDSFDSLKRFFEGNYDERLLLKSGLLSQKEATGHSYDKFRNRLMFPIRDRRGHTIAFGGRSLKEEDQPKYLNSPENEVFHKRRTLYGVHEIRENRKLEEIIVVEGYMDVISLYTHGIKNVVATLGTAVTDEHIRQLFRLCNRLVFCFDGDLAGHKAAVSALQHTLSVFRDGQSVGFLFLPKQEDPDSFVKTHGREALEQAAAEATPLSVFMFDHLSDHLDLALPEGRAAFAERVRPLLAETPRGAFRELITEELAKKAGVDAKHLLPAAPGASKPPPKWSGGGRKNRYSTVRVAVALLLLDPALEELALPCDEICKIDRPGTALLTSMLTHIKNNPNITTAALLEQYRGGEYEQSLIQLLNWEPPPDTASEFKHAMVNLHKLFEEQAFEQLIKKSQTESLSEKEKNELQSYLNHKAPLH